MKRILVLSLLGALVSLTGCAARSGYYRNNGPSYARVQVYRGANPGRGAVWIDGYWRGSAPRNVWVPGHWERRRR